MASIEIAVDFGSSNTYVFLVGNGIVFAEPTVASYTEAGSAKKLAASGVKAKTMYGRAPERTKIGEPVIEGVIFDRELARLYLRDVLKRITDSYLFPPRIKALVTIPCGLTVLERNEFTETFLAAGVHDVVLVDSVIAAAAGCDLPIDSTECGFTVNIGGGTTDIAAVSVCGIVNGCTVGIGGKNMDSAICDLVFERYNMEIGTVGAEKVKEEIGSLLANDGAAMLLSGRETASGKPMSESIAAKDIFDAVLPYYNRIADAVSAVLKVSRPEISELVQKTGITLSGGGAQILGLSELLSSRLRFPVRVARDARYAVIKGAGKLLNDKSLLEEVIKQN